MPDFERAFDSLRLHLADTARDSHAREWAKGYVAGKRRARIEVAVVAAVLYFGIALIGYFAGGGK